MVSPQPWVARERENMNDQVRSNAGDDVERASAIFQALYRDLHAMAVRFMRAESPGHTLEPTALVHEAYLRLSAAERSAWKNRTHFKAMAGRVMRHVLTDHARAKRALKRGGDWQRITLSSASLIGDGTTDMIDLDEALQKLESLDPRAARIVELRFFGGLTEVEVAEEIGISERTVRTEWHWARAMLKKQLIGG